VTGDTPIQEGVNGNLGFRSSMGDRDWARKQRKKLPGRIWGGGLDRKGVSLKKGSFETF